jgi:hypothetical protein
MKKIINILSISLMIPLVISCFTISYSTKGTSINPEIKTFSVQPFVNRASRVNPSLSQDMTNALIDYIESNTKLRRVTGLGDVDFKGEITNYDVRPTAISSGEVASQTRFTIGIKISYTDNTNPDNNFETTISRYRDFNSSQDFSSVENDLVTQMTDEIVEQIFNKAFVNW